MSDRTIHFRRVDEPFASAGVERWQAELFDTSEGAMFPQCLAFVVVFHVGAATHAQLNFISTHEQWRRRGYARQLLIACRERWPSLESTSPMNPAAQRMLKSVGLEKGIE